MSRDLAPLVRTHVVVGDLDQVRAAMERAKEAGRLVDIREVAPLPGRRLQVVADLREPARTRRWFATRHPWLIAAGVIGAAAAGGAVWLVVLGVIWLIGLITAVVAWVSAHLALFGLIAVVLVLMSGGVGAACAGLHCGGCRG